MSEFDFYGWIFVILLIVVFIMNVVLCPALTLTMIGFVVLVLFGDWLIERTFK